MIEDDIGKCHMKTDSADSLPSDSNHVFSDIHLAILEEISMDRMDTKEQSHISMDYLNGTGIEF
jgi:hypothetical protein